MIHVHVQKFTIIIYRGRVEFGNFCNDTLNIVWYEEHSISFNADQIGICGLTKLADDHCCAICSSLPPPFLIYL